MSAATIQQLVCDGGLRKIVLGDAGEVLYPGVKERFFSAPQRRALAVRDCGCCWPDCTAPPSWCEADHVIEYEKSGKTDINNGVLLCSAHHHALHASEFTIEMVNGKPRLLAPPWLDPDQLWGDRSAERARRWRRDRLVTHYLRVALPNDNTRRLEPYDLPIGRQLGLEGMDDRSAFLNRCESSA